MNQKEDAMIYRQKGRSAIREKNYKKASISYSRAVPLDRNNIQCLYGMGIALLEQKKSEGACLFFKRMTLMDPKNAKVHSRFGFLLYKLGKIDESIKMFKEAIRLDPADSNGHKTLAMLLRRRGDYEEAREHYIKALELQPEDAFEISNSIGCLYFLEGVFGKASEEFQKSINLNEKFTDAYWNKSLVLFCENRNEEAEKFFEEGVKMMDEEESKINMIKESIAIYTDHKARFEAKLNHEILNEEQMKLFRIMIDGLTKIGNLLTQQLDK